MKVKEVADLLHSPYMYIDKDLYHTVDIPEDVGDKEIDFMYINDEKVKIEDDYLAIVTKK